MVRTHSVWTTVGLIACLVGTQCSGTLFAADRASSSGDSAPLATVATTDVATDRSVPETPPLTFNGEMLTATLPAGPATERAWRSMIVVAPGPSNLYEQRGRGWGRGGRNDAARAEILLGAVAAIAGTALLVYANRPDCSRHEMASGCSYGTKVIGGAVLAGGIVSMVTGAVTWR